MPRRPRPATRIAPKNTVALPQSKPLPRPSREPVSSSENGSEQEEEGDNEEADSEKVDGNDEEDEDVDAPRISQWVDDDDLDAAASSSDNDETGRPGPSKLNSLEDDLSHLPLGALLKAQRALKQAQASDSVDSSEDDSDSEPEPQSTSLKGKEKAKPEWSTKPRNDIAKRANKHAPTEVTSKRPVTRRRTVVEVKTIQSRDPRFLPLTGEFSPQKFQQHYGFLSDSHKTELQTLRDNLKVARKRLASSPRELRSEREAEIGRLEAAVKRTESLVNQDRRTKVDQEALAKLNEAERAKRKEGKKGWWMKESEKKQFLLRARYDALAAEGGKRAVKKAVEKKQKKIGQKEKRSRPFARGSELKRKPVDGEGGPPPKKRRF